MRENQVKCEGCGVERNIKVAPVCPVCKYDRKVISSEEEQGSSNPKVTGSSPVSPTKLEKIAVPVGKQRQCTHKESKVTDSRFVVDRGDGTVIRRRRLCDCGLRFTTYEYFEISKTTRAEERARIRNTSSLHSHIKKAVELLNQLL